ncbi:hypothetical protein [Methylosinus sp. Sm6]|uniref:hypothetical protein n=1 Tax=Methylosinus sp. Sm6 TaxID=2866948 RepID=UPI001C9A25A5|nr:hypothetical protein [Methylosinus sp. Sm6]MBY6241632.1 hypothetical protein [Methylosinus sp. Sm6]
MSDELPAATVVHTMSGRTRLRLDEMRGDEKFFADAAQKLAEIGGVRRADPSPLTGGILLFHDAPLADIGEAAATAGLFRLRRNGSRPIEKPADPNLRPRTAAAVALALAAIWQINKEKLFPSALTLVWYAAALAGLRPAGGDDWSPDE